MIKTIRYFSDWDYGVEPKSYVEWQRGDVKIKRCLITSAIRWFYYEETKLSPHWWQFWKKEAVTKREITREEYLRKRKVR